MAVARYNPDLSGMPSDIDPALVGIIRRNLEQIALRLSGLGTGGGGGLVIGGGGGGSASAQTAHDHVLTRHLVSPWVISERVAVTGIVNDSPSAFIYFTDENTILVEIEG
jgi:hypothetical protein